MSEPTLRRLRARGAFALASREIHRVAALWTQTLLPASLTGVLYLAVFGGALGSRLGSVEDLPYVAFILPGVVLMAVAVQSYGNASTSLFQAKSEGYIEGVLMSPLRAWQIALASLVGGLARGWFAALAITLAALPFGGRVTDPEIAILTIAITGFLFASLGVVVGISAESFDQQAFVSALVIQPLALVGGIFYSARTLPEPWSTLTRLDPLYYLVDSARAGFTGFHESSLGLSLPVAAAVAAAIFGLATTLLARGWRLKP